ncbi:small ribosomal subunit protein mS35-like [Diadema antillarum]|uniref:small ribosomal subunit protein mS35-like n=1 Tax=Diadema antillarum TaxID=105358 RepID=UPI003A880541
MATSCLFIRNVRISSSTSWIVSSRYQSSTVNKSKEHYGSLVSTSLPDVDSEIEKVSPHSVRGKAMRAMEQRLKRFSPLPAPRESKMEEDQDWTAVYPTAASFKWSAVPLPIRMGYPVGRGIPPHKFGNLELIKIPNFLHLTPPAIKKHCAALKDLCTEWPTGLETDADCERHFPLETESSDYVFASPSLRHPKSREVTIRLKLSELSFDKHARWKFIQLIGDRYNKETDMVTISADRCPLRKQNYDYCIYLLSVLYHEAWITEPWESEITDEDMEKYVWDISPSKQAIISTLARIRNKDATVADVDEETERQILDSEDVQTYKDCVSDIRNAGESVESLERYKDAVLKLVHGKAPSGES